jgi:hypothetical protein
MSIRLSFAVAAAIAALATGVAAPIANAAPKPGDSCSTPGSAADGALSCDMQAEEWVSQGPSVTVGQSCSALGDVRLAGGENLARCTSTGSGQVWALG